MQAARQRFKMAVTEMGGVLRKRLSMEGIATYRTAGRFVLRLLPAISFLAAAVMAQSNYGPEVKAFLSFLRQEENELQFQITHNEISRKEFLRSKNRISVNRDAVLKFVKETGEDRVPDYNVVASSEADQLTENGARLMKSAKPGEVLGNKWRFIGSETRGEIFYILERVSRKASGANETGETE